MIPNLPDDPVGLIPTILLTLFIGADGSVARATVARPRSELRTYEDAALTAARSLKFRPAMRGGVPTAASLTYPMSFGAPRARAGFRLAGPPVILEALSRELRSRFEAETGAELRLAPQTSTEAIAMMLAGSADLATATRPLTTEERDVARRLGVTLTELVFGFDTAVIVVHQKNPLRSLTVAQATGLFDRTTHDWSTLGAGHGPVRPLQWSDGSEDEGSEALGFEEVVARVRDDPLAVGSVGLGFAAAGVKIVPLARGPHDMPVLPSAMTVQDGSYGAVRPLYAYTVGAPRDLARSWLRFVLSPTGKRLLAQGRLVPSLQGRDVLDAATSRAEPVVDGAQPARRPAVRRGERSSGAVSRDAAGRAAGKARRPVRDYGL